MANLTIRQLMGYCPEHCQRIASSIFGQSSAYDSIVILCCTMEFVPMTENRKLLSCVSTLIFGVFVAVADGFRVYGVSRLVLAMNFKFSPLD